MGESNRFFPLLIKKALKIEELTFLYVTEAD